MLDEGSEIPLGDLHLPQDLRQLHWNKSTTLSVSKEYLQQM